MRDNMVKSLYLQLKGLIKHRVECIFDDLGLLDGLSWEHMMGAKLYQHKRITQTIRVQGNHILGI